MDPSNPSFAVLVVEDEVFVRMDVAITIEDAGFKIYEAADADQAVRLLEEHTDIRVLFTDINMPGPMDGLELARYARDHWPPIKIIVTSGHPRARDMPHESVFLSKPCRPDRLIETLREMAA
jgi:CheY-like chemotaxis protein